MKSYCREYTLAVIRPLRTRYIYIYIYTQGHPWRHNSRKKIWRTELACLMNADTCLHFHSTYFKDLFSSPIDINLGETLSIFSSARNRSVPLHVNLMADFETIREVHVWSAAQHATPPRSAHRAPLLSNLHELADSRLRRCDPKWGNERAMSTHLYEIPRVKIKTRHIFYYIILFISLW